MQKVSEVTLPKHGRFGVLEDPNMRWFFGGQLVSIVGSTLQTAVLSLLIIKITPGKEAAYWVGVTTALTLLPGALFAPFVGAFLDKVDRLRVLKTIGLLGALQALALATAVLTGTATIPVICALTFALGFINTVDSTGKMALMTEVIKHGHHVRSATALFTSVYNVGQVVGAGTAGFLVLKLGHASAFVLNALTFGFIIVALSKIRLSKAELKSDDDSAKRHVIHRLWCDGKIIFADPGIRLGAIMLAIVSGLGHGCNSLLAVIAKDVFGGGPDTFSMLAAASGVGSFIGCFTSIFLMRRWKCRNIVIGGVITMGILLLLTPLVHSKTMGAIAFFLVGLAFMVSFTTIRGSMNKLAKEKLPRKVATVAGLTTTILWGGVVISAFSLGVFAKHFGCVKLLILTGVLLLLVGLIIPFMKGINDIE